MIEILTATAHRRKYPSARWQRDRESSDIFQRTRNIERFVIAGASTNIHIR